MEKFYSHLRIGLNCKNPEKASRLKVKIEKILQLQIHNAEYVEHEENQFVLIGYCELDYPSKEDVVFNWLFHLELLGYNWQVKAPNIYQDFFSFEGERWANQQNFIVPGMNFVTFELTNRVLDYYDSAPLSEYQKVIILESELTIEERINGLDGYVSSIGIRTDGIWNFGVHINKVEQIYMLSENELKTLKNENET